MSKTCYTYSTTSGIFFQGDLNEVAYKNTLFIRIAGKNEVNYDKIIRIIK